MMWLFAILIVLAMGGVAVVASGRGGSMAPAYDDRPDLDLPTDRPLAARDLLTSDRLTILHGNHDLASSGAHPRRTADLWRHVLRFWDPPPVVALRKRRFGHA